MSVEATIRNKLSSNLKTVHLEIINESYMHNVPKGSETHFKVLVVSELFKNLPLLKVGRNSNLYRNSNRLFSAPPHGERIIKR